MSDEECVASLSTPVWCFVTGGTAVDSGIISLQSELETGEEMAMEVGRRLPPRLCCLGSGW